MKYEPKNTESDHAFSYINALTLCGYRTIMEHMKHTRLDNYPE